MLRVRLCVIASFLTGQYTGQLPLNTASPNLNIVLHNTQPRSRCHSSAAGVITEGCEAAMANVLRPAAEDVHVLFGALAYLVNLNARGKPFPRAETGTYRHYYPRVFIYHIAGGVLVLIYVWHDYCLLHLDARRRAMVSRSPPPRFQLIARNIDPIPLL